jgi:hypothetical protein
LRDGPEQALPVGAPLRPLDEGASPQQSLDVQASPLRPLDAGARQ